MLCVCATFCNATSSEAVLGGELMLEQQQGKADKTLLLSFEASLMIILYGKLCREPSQQKTTHGGTEHKRQMRETCSG